MMQRAQKRHVDAKQHSRSNCRRCFGDDDGFYSWRPRAAGGGMEYVLMLEMRRPFSHGLSRDPVFAAITPHVRASTTSNVCFKFSVDFDFFSTIICVRREVRCRDGNIWKIGTTV